MNRPVQLHCDLVVDPAKAADAERYFETVYRPEAEKFEGYIDLRLLKLRAVLAGEPPGRANYRFAITYRSEELRQKWIQSDVHQVVWPKLQTFLLSDEFDFLLFEAI
jgi:heme-degrading monooxygenase HmoA